MSLLQVNETTWVDPRSTRIALMTNATEPERRELWVVLTARPNMGIEVERQYHARLLDAMGVDLGEIARQID